MRTLLIIFAVGFLNMACNKSIWIDQEPNIDTSTFKTYTWNTLKSPSEASYYDLKEIERTLKTEVDRLLLEKGMVKLNEGPVDFFIDYHIYIKENYYEEQYCPTGFYGQQGFVPTLSAWPNCEVEEKTIIYDSGTMVIDVIDMRTGQLVWRGSSFNVIDNPVFAPEIFEKKIHRLLNSFGEPM